MDKQKRKKIANRLRKLLKDGNFDGNADFKRLIKTAIRQPFRIMNEDDDFCFDPERCITECDGRCCMEIDCVRVTPTDVDYMMKSPTLRGNSRKDVVNHTLKIMLGSSSRIPMAIIKSQHIPDEKFRMLHICPFMRAAHRFTVNVGLDELEINDSGIGGICMLGQQYKPSICMLYPMGRITSLDLENIEEERIYVRMDCEGTKTAKKMNVADWVANYEEKFAVKKRYVRVMADFIQRLQEEIEDADLIEGALIQLAAYFYYDELPTEKKLDIMTDNIDTIFQLIDKKKKIIDVLREKDSR